MLEFSPKWLADLSGELRSILPSPGHSSFHAPWLPGVIYLIKNDPHILQFYLMSDKRKKNKFRVKIDGNGRSQGLWNVK